MLKQKKDKDWEETSQQRIKRLEVLKQKKNKDREETSQQRVKRLEVLKQKKQGLRGDKSTTSKASRGVGTKKNKDWE